MKRGTIKHVLRAKRTALLIGIVVIVIVVIVAICSHSLGFYYPLVNLGKAKTVTIYFPLTEFPEEGESIELSADAAAEVAKVLKQHKYWRKSYWLSHLLDERVGWTDSLWEVHCSFENGLEMTVDYSESGTLVVYQKRSGGFFPEGSAVNRKTRHYKVDGAEQLVKAILDIAVREFEPDWEEPDPSARTVKDAYPGLYFAERQTLSGGTEMMACRLVNGESVLVGGYVSHRNIGYDVLIHADGTIEVVWADRDVVAMFEELLEPYKAPSEGGADLTTSDYANEIMAAIGSFVEARRAIPQDCLRYLTEAQRAMAEKYNGQTLDVRSAVVEAAIQAVSVVKGAEGYPWDYYDYADEDYRMIGQLIDTLLFPDYEKRIKENAALNNYLSVHPDSVSRLNSVLEERFATLSEYDGITLDSYCELVDRFYRSLNQSGAVPAGDTAMDVAMLILERRTIPEDLRSKLDRDIAELVTQYNEQIAGLKEFYYQDADSRCYVLFYEQDRETQKWYREQFPQRLSTYVLYENYTELVWSDPLVSQPACVESGGSYGLWAYYFQREGPQLEVAQRIVDHLSLVESLLITLNGR